MRDFNHLLDTGQQKMNTHTRLIINESLSLLTIRYTEGTLLLEIAD